MSLAKVARTTTTAAQPYQPGTAYTKTCPPTPPSTPTTPPTSSGGASGCFPVPIYTQVPLGQPDGNGVYHQFTYQLTSYKMVCYS
jgi:hypothetical protein